MRKREFYSQLFQRKIYPNDKDFSPIVKAELLYRIDNLKNEACSCYECKHKLGEYTNYYNNLKSNKSVAY